jgi:hypothetical protein
MMGQLPAYQMLKYKMLEPFTFFEPRILIYIYMEQEPVRCTLFINDLIQSYCLQQVLNNQLFIFRTTCT